MQNKIFKEFKQAGKELFAAGLIAAKSGNMSLRMNKKIIITAHGAMLGRLKEEDLIEVDLSNRKSSPKISKDLEIHRRIYEKTDARAVLHAHPIYAIALSLIKNKIELKDVEGCYYFQRVPVVNYDNFNKIAAHLKNGKIVIAKAHGTYAKGKDIEYALFWTTSLENSCKIIFLYEALSSVKNYLQ